MKYILLINFLMASMVYADSQQENLMPFGFDQVRIGMDWRSLVALRPNAEIMNMMPNPDTDLKPDQEKPKAGLVEKLTTGTFDRVLYSFENGVLVAVMFGKDKTRSALGEKENVIRKVAQKHGMPIRIEFVGNRQEQGVLTWQDQSLHINVIAPTDDADPTRSVIGLQIMSREYAERIKAIGVFDDVDKGNNPQGADEQRLDNFKSEIKKLLSEKVPGAIP